MTSIPVCGHIHGLDALSQERREVTIKAAANEVIIELEIPGRKNDGPPSIAVFLIHALERVYFAR